jgi:TrmH family RNA methyltransferase
MERSSPHNPLSSKENKTFKFLSSLSDPKVRKREKAFLIEGVKMVEEALRDRAGVREVVASPALTGHHGRSVVKLAEKTGVNILWISERLMDSIAETKTPQPVMALVEMLEHAEDPLFRTPPGLIVLCHELQDPGNLGTIIRTAEAVGAAGVVVTGNAVDPYNQKAVRASMGSILRVPVVRAADAGGFLSTCRQKGFQTVALTLSSRQAHFNIDLKKPSVVIVGQEGSGLQEELLKEVDLLVRIPMAGTIDSLNVATSAAVLLYEAVRQRS